MTTPVKEPQEVFFHYPDPVRGGMVTEATEWVNGKTLKHYFKDLGLTALSFRCYVFDENHNRLRMGHMPLAGQAVTLTLAGQAAS